MVGKVKYSYTNIMDAVTAVQGGLIPSDGFIHVDAGTLPNQQVEIDALIYPSLLKLKGIVGNLNPDTGAPDAILSNASGSGSYIFVYGMINGFTLSRLNITGDTTSQSGGVVYFAGNKGTILLQDLVVNNKSNNIGDSGIYITSQNGAITLKNVQSNNNPHVGGAYLNNSANTTRTAGVSITNSSFDENAGNSTANGVYIRTNDPVSITGSSASRNIGTLSSMWIQDASAITIKSSAFVGNTNHLGLAADGFSGRLKANVTLQDVYADNNEYGMVIFTYGNITLTNVSASGNTNYGAVLDTCDLSGSCLNTTGTGKVTISGSTFNSNLNTAVDSNYFGLWVKARGAVALTNVTASHNGTTGGHNAFGAYLQTEYSNLVSPVTVKSSSFFSNYGHGLWIESKGAINLTSVIASNAVYGYGAMLYNGYTDSNAGVTLAGTAIAKNDFSGNYFYGIWILSRGAIKINYLNALYNKYPNICLDNSLPGVIQPVSLSNIEAGYNTNNDGLDIYTRGAVTVTNFKGEYNHGYGVQIGTLSTQPSSVSINNAQINYNIAANLFLVSAGNVTLSYVNADSCAALLPCNGVELGDSFTMTPIGGNVTISNSTFNHNNGFGLWVYAKGALKLTGITANGNTRDGALLDNRASLPTLYPAASITNGTFSSNGNCGVKLFIRGKITLTNITASENLDDGAYIVNALGSVSLLTTGSSVNTFFHNGSDGVHLEARGAIAANKVFASNNDSGNTGMYLNNRFTGVTGGVSISTGEFNNQGYGLSVYSFGAISVKGISAQNNSLGEGAWLDNHTSTAVTPPGVTISGSSSISNFFNYNSFSGLKILSRGPISISYTTANFNGLRGIDLDEIAVTGGGGNVTLKNVTTNYNSFSGIYANIHGTFTGSYIKSIYNANINIWDGLTLYAYDSAVTISNSLFMGNGDYGIWCTFKSGSLAPFKLTNVVTVGNWEDSQIYVGR
jgi:hypothetical protein